MSRSAGLLPDPARWQGRFGRVLLRGAERLLLVRRHPCPAPQLFILGLPRSGTTLICQYLVHRLEAAFFTNGVGFHPAAPAVVSWIERRRHGPYRSDFRSDYGHVRHPLGPREGGGVWGRFFDFEAYAGPGALSEAAAARLANTVHALQRLQGHRLFINKNVKHLLRLAPLAALFPQARFLVVDRDRRDVALSVLRARHRRGADPGRWWSIRPPSYSALRTLPIPEQVAGQLRDAQARMETDLSGIDGRRVRRIDYAAFCRAPEALVTALSADLGAPCTANPPVASFRCARNAPRTAEEEALLAILEAGGSLGREGEVEPGRGRP